MEIASGGGKRDYQSAEGSSIDWTRQDWHQDLNCRCLPARLAACLLVAQVIGFTLKWFSQSVNLTWQTNEPLLTIQRKIEEQRKNRKCKRPVLMGRRLAQKSLKSGQIWNNWTNIEHQRECKLQPWCWLALSLIGTNWRWAPSLGKQISTSKSSVNFDLSKATQTHLRALNVIYYPLSATRWLGHRFSEKPRRVAMRSDSNLSWRTDRLQIRPRKHRW